MITSWKMCLVLKNELLTKIKPNFINFAVSDS